MLLGDVPGRGKKSTATTGPCRPATWRGFVIHGPDAHADSAPDDGRCGNDAHRSTSAGSHGAACPAAGGHQTRSIIMCTTDQTCDCWDNGYAHCLGQLKTWASGTHGRNCDCDGCVVAVIILKNALHASGPSWTSSRRPHRARKRAAGPPGGARKGSRRV